MAAGRGVADPAAPVVRPHLPARARRALRLGLLVGRSVHDRARQALEPRELPDDL